MRKNIARMAQRETGRTLRDDASRLAKLETQEFPVATAIAALAISGTWSPAITGSVSNPTVAYTENVGRYTVLFDLLCFYSFRIVINTYSGGSGNLRVSLPFTNSNVNAADLVRAAANLSGVDVTATTPYGLHFRPELGAAYGIYQIASDNATTVTTAVGDAAAGDTISASGWYWV